MKAAVFNGIRDITIEEIEKPMPGPDDFVLKVKAAALCGSDLRTYLHGHPKIKTPHVLGHEFAGVVESVGENVTFVKVGDRVAVHPGVPCGHCYYCDRGQQNMCETRKQIGGQYPGAFAEYVNIPGKCIEVGTVVHIPEECSFEIATLGDPLVSALNGQEILNVQYGDTVLILGAGPIGYFHAMLARLKGAGNIILANRSQGRLDYAKEHNIADNYYCIGRDAKDIKPFRDYINSMTEGRGAEVVIVANTSTESARQAVQLAAKNGKVLLFAGFPKDAPELGVDGNLIHYNQLNVMGALGSTPRQYQLAEKMLFTNKINGNIMITHRIPLEEINEGFQKMIDGEGVKIVIDKF
ncbi:alcohol dehydrogenase catalytic domain-containing protein [Anaeropeptidivorans aminofermentans]|uniref:alcohol dehydrogenase catalytic domain-containing protein n=1 Tax=Anaeropeptidivorans aminofermentans TaxID=2934315 RepID=UPI0020242B54|nr:alcohol dehydrogenase catalytic domain-containing protein [Anaeropeptidivorans aminofermentans]